MNRTPTSRVTALVLTVLLCLLGIACTTEQALGWSGVEKPVDLNTHALILRGSYAQLSRDPLFREVNFPALNGILAREGVRWKPSASSLPFSVKSLLDAEGPGPDVEGASRYSQHWYNPRTRKGDTPVTVGDFFSKLVRGILTGDTPESNWGASWSAHFLADMNAPHHVVGIPAGDAEYRNIWGAPAGGTAWKLSEDEAGPLWLVHIGGNVLSPEWGEAYDFKRAVEVFVGARRESGKILEFRDWFDPWYWNGSGGGIDPLQLYGPFTLNSSHVSWEKWAHGQVRDRDFTSPKIRYHPEWHNGWLSFDDTHPWTAQVLQAAEFTKAAASNTRENLRERFDNPRDGINDAIWRVATVWRAAVSALALNLSWNADPSRPGTIEVKGVVENRAPTGAYDVKARLAILTGSEPRYLEVKNIGSIKGGRAVGSAVWQVPVDEVRSRRLRLEVIGHFDDNQPDLQYAMLEQEARDIPTSAFDLVKAQELLIQLGLLAADAERLEQEANALCRGGLAQAGEAGEASAACDSLTGAIATLRAQVGDLKVGQMRAQELTEAVRRYHAEAEAAVTSLGQITHQLEALSLTLCEAARAVARARTMDERRRLYVQVQANQGNLRGLLAQANEQVLKARRAAQSARNARTQFPAVPRDGGLVGLEAGFLSLGQAERASTEARSKANATRNILTELAEIRRKADSVAAEFTRVLEPAITLPEAKQAIKEIEGLVGRVAQAQERASAWNCADQIVGLAEAASGRLNGIRSTLEQVNQERASLLQGLGTGDPSADAERLAGLAEFLSQMANAYLERARTSSVDGGTCVVLAQDALNEPLKVAVPGVRGQPLDQARSVIAAVGLSAAAVPGDVAPRPDSAGKVQSQSPEPNEEVAAGSQVTLRVFGQFDMNAALDALDCPMRFPGSSTVWSEKEQRAGCVCPDPPGWNADKTACNVDRAAALAALDCDSTYPGSVAFWSEVKQRAGCVCPDPPGWNADKTACNKLGAKVVEALDCGSKYPGSVVVWDEGKQMQVCRCVPPKKWNAAHTACIGVSITTKQDPMTTQGNQQRQQQFQLDCLKLETDVLAAINARNLPLAQSLLARARQMNCPLNPTTEQFVRMAESRQPTPGPAPTPSGPVRQVKCNDTAKSGGNTPETVVVNLGGTFGVFRFEYDMYDVPDRMIVRYGGGTHDTGCTGGKQGRGRDKDSVDLRFSGSSQVTIQVQPSCQGGSTSWKFTVHCPR